MMTNTKLIQKDFLIVNLNGVSQLFGRKSLKRVKVYPSANLLRTCLNIVQMANTSLHTWKITNISFVNVQIKRQLKNISHFWMHILFSYKLL